MTNAHLRACPSCARHARVSETACPFCGAAFDQAFRSTPEPQGPRVRLARAALVAFGALGAGSLAATTACSSSTSAPEPAYGGTPVMTEPVDGSATQDDSGDAGSTTPSEASAGDATTDGPVATPAYGAPGMPIVDASEDQHVVLPPYGIAPMYGAPAPPYGIAPVDVPAGDLGDVRKN
jgi:hypothetical protein